MMRRINIKRKKKN